MSNIFFWTETQNNYIASSDTCPLHSQHNTMQATKYKVNIFATASCHIPPILVLYKHIFPLLLFFCQEILVYLQQNITSDKLAFTSSLELFIYDMFLFSTMVWYVVCGMWRSYNDC